MQLVTPKNTDLRDCSAGVLPRTLRAVAFYFSLCFSFHPFRVIIVGEIALSRGCAIAPPRAVIFSPFQGLIQAIIKFLVMSRMSMFFRMRRPCPVPCQRAFSSQYEIRFVSRTYRCFNSARGWFCFFTNGFARGCGLRVFNS